MQHLQQACKQGRTKSGFATLFGVVIMTAVATLGLASMGYISKNSLLSTRSFLAGERAKSASNSCMELALEEVRVNTAFSGNVTRSFAFSTCSASVVSGISIVSTGESQKIKYVLSTTVNATDPKIDTSAWIRQ